MAGISGISSSTTPPVTLRYMVAPDRLGAEVRNNWGFVQFVDTFCCSSSCGASSYRHRRSSRNSPNQVQILSIMHEDTEIHRSSFFSIFLGCIRISAEDLSSCWDGEKFARQFCHAFETSITNKKFSPICSKGLRRCQITMTDVTIGKTQKSEVRRLRRDTSPRCIQTSSTLGHPS